MPTVGANFLTIVHKKSNGISIAFPDVCKTPTPPGPVVPIPYPNIAKSSDTAQGTKTVKIEGCMACNKPSNFMTSTGDEAGSATGVVSSKIKGKAEWVMTSFDVKAEGQGVARAFDIMLHNDKNTPPFPVIQPPIFAMPSDFSDESNKKDWDIIEIEEMEE